MCPASRAASSLLVRVSPCLGRCRDQPRQYRWRETRHLHCRQHTRPQPNLGETVPRNCSALDKSAHRRAMTMEVSEVASPRIGVRVEVDQGDVAIVRFLELSRGRRFQALAVAENWIFLSDIFPDSVRRIKIDRFRTRK